MCERCKAYCEFVRKFFLNKTLPCPNCGQNLVANEITPELSDGRPVFRFSVSSQSTRKGTFDNASSSSTPASKRTNDPSSSTTTPASKRTNDASSSKTPSSDSAKAANLSQELIKRRLKELREMFAAARENANSTIREARRPSSKPTTNSTTREAERPSKKPNNASCSTTPASKTTNDASCSSSTPASKTTNDASSSSTTPASDSSKASNISQELIKRRMKELREKAAPAFATLEAERVSKNPMKSGNINFTNEAH